MCVDHLCGHDRQQEDGLNAKNMNKYFGGKQSKMYSLIFLQERGFLGPYKQVLKVGDKQHFTFFAKDEGPFWMGESERNARRQDRKTSKIKTKVLSVRELMVAINSKMPSLHIKDLKNKNKQDIETFATGLGIPLQYEYEEIKDKKWVGEAKALLQVLWEQGFVNKRRIVSKYYNMSGTKDQYGNVDKSTSLVTLMEQCYDFVNKLTLLQEKLATLGIQVYHSPKCHSELAGEDIEYSWGFAKNWYRRLPLKMKKSKENFCASVHSVM